MKTFATHEKRPAPAVSRSHHYVHHPMVPVQQAQQIAMRKILRPDEVQAKPNIDEYDQGTEHVVADLPVSAISGIPPDPLGGAATIQRSENEEPEEELQRQPKEEEPIQAKLIQRQTDNEEEEEPIQAKSLSDQITPFVQRQEKPEEEAEPEKEDKESIQAKQIQRKVADIRMPQPSRFGYIGSEAKAQQTEIHRILHSNGTQPKLTISQPNDKYEQEADRVADQVMAMPDPKLQRQPENEEGEETLQTKPLADQIKPLVQRQEEYSEEEPVKQQLEENEDEELQGKEQSGRTPQVTPNVAANIQSLKGGGQSLADSTRSFFESRFGQDFSQVRIHTDVKAANTALEVQARAFTLGNNIVFNSGQYSANNQEGKKLLAHELTHVVQQSRTGSSSLQRQVENTRRQRFLRQIPVPSSGVDGIPDSAIKATEEFASFMDSRNIWQWQDHFGEAEALLACRLIIADLHTGLHVNWLKQARTYMNLARYRLNARQPDQSAQPVPATPKKGGKVPVQEPTTPAIAPEDTKCGKHEEASLVIKGSGKIPESLRTFGEEWELRFIQRGTCCRTYVFRLKVGSGPKWQDKASKLVPLTAESKIRGDLRRTDNICTNQTSYGGRLSWEGKLTLYQMERLKRALGKRGLSGGVFEVVVKPQIGVNVSEPDNKNNLMRLTGFIKVRLGAELNVGNNVIVEVRWHPFECNYGWLEIGYRDIRSWDISFDECLARLKDYITKNAIPEVKLPEQPRLPLPWYKQTNTIPDNTIF